MSLRNVLKMYGEMTVKDASGAAVRWFYDYARDEPVKECEFTPERRKASAIAHFEEFAEQERAIVESHEF